MSKFELRDDYLWECIGTADHGLQWRPVLRISAISSIDSPSREQAVDASTSKVIEFVERACRIFEGHGELSALEAGKEMLTFLGNTKLESVVELRKALEPFAKRADYFDRKINECGEVKTWSENTYYADDPPSDIYVQQLRTARAALATSPSPAPTEITFAPTQMYTCKANADCLHDAAQWAACSACRQSNHTKCSKLRQVRGFGKLPCECPRCSSDLGREKSDATD